VTKRDIVVGRFHEEPTVIEAVRAIRACGLRIADVYSPYPVHRLDDALGIERSRLPLVTLAGGACGLVAGLALELYTSVVDWPMNVGGKPDASLLAFVPIAFELTILGAGLATAAGLLLRSRLAPFRAATVIDRAATDDTFAVVVNCRDTALDRRLVEQMMLNYGAATVESRAVLR
jgi:Alternative complex III, ActD subunit